MPPARQQQKRLLLLLKRGRWPYYAAIILIACAFWLLHQWFELNAGTIDQMAKPFPSSEAAWGLRAYLILIGCSADLQTVT